MINDDYLATIKSIALGNKITLNLNTLCIRYNLLAQRFHHFCHHAPGVSQYCKLCIIRDKWHVKFFARRFVCCARADEFNIYLVFGRFSQDLYD